MKFTAKIIIMLICVGLLGLCACGNNGENTTEPDSSAAPETEITSDETKEEQSGDIDIGGGIVLPEDGKITFGKDKENTSTTENTSASEENSSSENEITTEESTTANSSDGEKTTKNADNNTASQSDSAADDRGWENIQWN